MHLVVGDVKQTLYNVLLNAIQASPEGSEVVVEANREGEHVSIGVTDQGPGIAPDDLPHIFEPFFTTKESESQGGMGLGLSVSHSLVTSMGGTIEARNAQGGGASFAISLPVKDLQPQ
jgi:signal transduction histidine kinase